MLLVGDLAERLRGERRRVQRCGQLRDVELVSGNGERVCCGKLEVAGALQVADPDGSVDRRAADRAVPLRDDLARYAAQRVLAVDAEEMELVPPDGVDHARVALSGADAADHCRRRVGAPVDRAVGRPDQRTWAARHARIAVVDRLGHPSAGGDRRHRIEDGLDRGAADLVAVDAALPRLANAERA